MCNEIWVFNVSFIRIEFRKVFQACCKWAEGIQSKFWFGYVLSEEEYVITSCCLWGIIFWWQHLVAFHREVNQQTLGLWGRLVQVKRQALWREVELLFWVSLGFFRETKTSLTVPTALSYMGLVDWHPDSWNSVLEWLVSRVIWRRNTYFWMSKEWLQLGQAEPCWDHKLPTPQWFATVIPFVCCVSHSGWWVLAHHSLWGEN